MKQMQRVEKIGIVLATYNPNLEYLQKQINSIKHQTCKNWICHIVDDCSLTKYQVGIKRIIAYDPRFICHFHSNNVNHYYNFERGLQYCLEDKSITAIAFADQDDIWQPEKLTVLLEQLRLNSAVLVHSDLELINSDDETIHPSAWQFESRKPEKLSLELLLLRNVVTGCSLLFCTSLLPDILPFPPQTNIGWYHDWWIALVAAHKGEIVHIHQPLVSYRIHDANNVGVVQNSGRLHQEIWELFRKKLQIAGNGYLVHRDLSQAFYNRFYLENYQNPFDDQKLDFGLNIFSLFYQSLRQGYNSEGVAFRVGLLKILFDLQKVYQLICKRQ
jgi:glycosyltransferase involved in cell wall biosynthesis